jgi:hypothetical protein
MTQWIVEPDRQLAAGFAVEWTDGLEFILSRHNRLFRATSLGGPLEAIGSVAQPSWRMVATRVRAVQRLLRSMFYNVVPLPDGSIFTTFDRSVGVIRDGHYQPVRGLVRPVRCLRGACAIDGNGVLYFGEYDSNDERRPVHIYRLTAGSTALEIAHTFPAGSIRHVHGIYFDRFEKSLWCTTGDHGSEAKFLRTSDGFKTTEVIGEGDETWRCVSLLFRKDAVYYGMDAEFIQNHIYRLDRRTGKRDVLTPVDGPVYYSRAQGHELFFGVTAELCPSQKGRAAAVWNVAEDDSAQRIASFEKDRLRRDLFMYGTLHFSLGPGLPDRFWVQGVALAGADGQTYCVRQH